MRRKKSIRVYVVVFLAFLFLLGISTPYTRRLQGLAVAALAPALDNIQNLDKSIKHNNSETEKLRLENLLLANQVRYLTEILQNEAFIDLQEHEITNEKSLDYLKRLRRENFRLLLSEQLQSVPARVIYRPLGTWTHVLWINVGESTNTALGKPIIAKNSPVVIGMSIVGVIDYIGSNQSRVRLITDSGLTPSVRVMRREKDGAIYLAKGELRGSLEANWRELSSVLKGIGFNYDYPDEEGPARDLRTGEVSLKGENNSQIAIIQKGDLLITTGMDGVFPMGLHAAEVSHVNLLKEGDYAYEIEARACVSNFDDLTTLFVLPPVAPNMNLSH